MRRIPVRHGITPSGPAWAPQGPRPSRDPSLQVIRTHFEGSHASGFIIAGVVRTEAPSRYPPRDDSAADRILRRVTAEVRRRRLPENRSIQLRPPPTARSLIGVFAPLVPKVEFGGSLDRSFWEISLQPAFAQAVVGVGDVFFYFGRSCPEKDRLSKIRRGWGPTTHPADDR